jgi:hypothetical protein
MPLMEFSNETEVVRPHDCRDAHVRAQSLDGAWAMPPTVPQTSRPEPRLIHLRWLPHEVVKPALRMPMGLRLALGATNLVPRCLD